MSRIILFTAIVIFVLFLVISTWLTLPKHYIVTRTETGFSPKELHIQKGDLVTFTSTRAIPYWPASDYHPSHGRYPAFDPGHELGPDETWTFVFDKAGVWSMHDHLDATVTGTIFVLGDEGESIASCLETNTDTLREVCWEGELKVAIERGGLAEGFRKFSAWYANDPQFQRNCHDIGHVLGKVAYAQFKETGISVVEPETTYCGYGFYHGFIEAATQSTGAFDLKEAVDYCYALAENPKITNKIVAHNISGACFHGLGHAVFDSVNSSLWGDDRAMVHSSLQACENAIGKEWERGRCASGVFNSLAGAYSDRAYKLDFNDSEPLRACTAGSLDYHSECSQEIGIGYVRDRNKTIEESLDFFARIGIASSTLDTINAYMGDEIRRNRSRTDFSIQAYVAVCEHIRDYEQARSCVQGLVEGFSLSSPAGEETTHTLDSCVLYTNSALRSFCFNEAGTEVEAYRGRAALPEWCATLSAADRTAVTVCAL